MEFHTKLKNYRIKQKLTQVELATRLGISTRQLQRLEGGLFHPSYATLMRFIALTK